MTQATFDQNAISAQLRTAGILNFALAKPCYRHDAFGILGKEAAPSPQPGKQSKSRTPSSPRHNAVAGSSDWSMLCLPDTHSQQHASDYDDEESVIAEFLSGSQQALSNTSAAQPNGPQPHRQLSSANASKCLAGSRDLDKRVSAGSPGCLLAGAPRRCRVQHAASAAHREIGVSCTTICGVSRAGKHSVGTPAAMLADVQWDRSPGSAPQTVAQLVSSSDSDITGPSYSRHHANSLRSQHTSSKAAHRLQHRAVPARSNRGQRSESYTGALRKRQAVHAQAQQMQRPAVRQQTGTISSSTAPDLSDPQLKYKALLLKAFKQQPPGHCHSQRPGTNGVSSSNNSAGQHFTAARTIFGVHADVVHRAPPPAARASASRPPMSGGSIGSASLQQPATDKGTAATGKAMLFGALDAVTAANAQAAAALSAAARQAKASVRLNPYVAVEASKAVSDDALIQMITGWYRTADFGSSERDLSAQHVEPIGNDKQQQQQQKQQQDDQQQWQTGAGEPSVITEPSSSSTWSDGYPCGARCMCGVGYSWVGRHLSQQQHFPFEQVCAGSDKKATACEQRRQHGGLQHKAGDKVISIAVLAGVEPPPLQELAEASSIIDELQHGLVNLRWTAEKLSHGDEVPGPLRQRYTSPIQAG